MRIEESRPTSVGAAAVLADLAEGAAAIRLGELVDHPAAPRKHGKKLHRSAPLRWAAAGVRGERLETARTPTGTVTTIPALLRFLARLNPSPAGSVPRNPLRAGRAHAAAERELEGAGF